MASIQPPIVLSFESSTSYLPAARRACLTKKQPQPASNVLWEKKTRFEN